MVGHCHLRHISYHPIKRITLSTLPHPINHSPLLALQDIAQFVCLHPTIPYTGSYAYLMALAKRCLLHCLYRLDTDIAVTISLDCTSMFHLPYIWKWRRLFDCHCSWHGWCNQQYPWFAIHYCYEDDCGLCGYDCNVQCNRPPTLSNRVTNNLQRGAYF